MKRKIRRLGYWCGALLLLAELFMPKHSHAGAEEALFFRAWFGFGSAAVCILTGVVLGKLPFFSVTPGREPGA